MPLVIVRDDITKVHADAIVNAANNELRMGGGVCGAIFRAAGPEALQEACDAIGYCETGQAVITDGYNLPARRVIHTPGPVWRGGGHGEAELLRNCYMNSLRLAMEHGCASVAFPLISAGIYGYPKEEALRIATDTIGEYLEEHDLDVRLVVFDKDSFQISRERIGEVQAFIDEHYADKRASAGRRLLSVEAELLEQQSVAEIEKSDDAAAPEEEISNLEETFSRTLLRLMDAKGLKDVQVYRRANIDRRLFSGILSNPACMPSKRTAIALAVALELSVSETEALLEKAGYTLSRSQKFDVIVEYFIRNRNYHIFEINEVLFHFDQSLLGS